VAGNIWGADVAELRTLAQQFGKASDTLLNQSTDLSNQINNNPSWKGQDAARFRSDWNGSHRALIQQAAFALKQESRKLLENADQQEKASNGAPGSGGGPGGGSQSSPNDPRTPEGSTPGPWGPGWLSDGDSPFRKGWDGYNGVLGLKNVPWGLRDISQFAAKNGDDIAAALRNGDYADALRSIRSKDLWNAAAAEDSIRGAFSGTANLLGGKFGDLAEMAHGANIRELSKVSLNAPGYALGGLGVALDGLDTVNAAMAGETGDAIKSGLKTALGVGSFFPPPVNVTCMVIGGAWAAVELIPGAKDGIDDFFDGFGDVAEDGAQIIGDGVKSFFGF
jgi:uncharacterized protein YukE